MPVYEYECGKCGARMELLRKMADADAPLSCEKCGSRDMTRAHSVFTAAASSTPTPAMPAGPCGRCGDPNGACGL